MHIGTHMYTSLARALMVVVGVAATGAFAASAADPKYRITDIGTLGGSYTEGAALNASGQVTGYSITSGNTSAHAFLWRNDGTPMVDLGPFDPSGAPTDFSAGVALNAAGQVTGHASPRGGGADYAFVWKNDGTPMKNLGTLGGKSSQGADINDLGQVVGVADLPGNVKHHAFLWKNNGQRIQDLGTLGGSSSAATALNGSGQVTGYADRPGDIDTHAFLWRNDGTPMKNLGTIGGHKSSGVFINSSGQVAGISNINVHNKNAYHAFLWRNDGTRMVNLGTLGGMQSRASALNESGQIVGLSTHQLSTFSGAHAYLWKNDGTPIINLGNVDPFGDQSGGLDINDAGWVVGFGTESVNFSNRAFLWRDDGLGMRDLNDLIDPADPLKPYVVLEVALAINDAGDILARGSDTRGTGSRAYFLRGSSLALAPRVLAFANQTVGTSSTSKSVTMQNNSSSVVPVTSIALAGSGAGQFALTHNCGSAVVGNGSCTIKVVFKPNTKGAKSATLSVNGGGGGLRVVSLAGTGI